MPENKAWVVQKFGGSALKEKQHFAHIASIVADYVQTQRVALVTSALYGVTDNLEDLIEIALTSTNDKNSADVRLQEKIQALLDLHEDWARASLSSSDALNSLLESNKSQIAALEEKLQGIRMLGHCPDATRAEILVSGELLSSQLLQVYLSEKLHTESVDLFPFAHIKASVRSEETHVLNASFDIEATRRLVDSETKADVILIPGFVATDENNRIVTLGRNGSDYTAAGFAAVLAAGKCQIWKDVDGIYTADPRIVPSSLVLDEVSYTEAMELSYFGAKVINAKALLPLTQHDIPCEIRNFLKPEHKGTLIHAVTEVEAQSMVKGVTHREGLSSITLSGLGLRGMVGFARRVSDALARNGISIILIVQSSSEYSLTLCVPTEVGEQAKQALETEFYYELQQHLVEPVNLEAGKAAVSLVGEGMQHKRGIAARFLEAIASARVNVEILAQGSTESAIAIVVSAETAPIAVKAAHSAFFSEQMPLDIILLGCGTVGSALLEQMQRQQKKLSKQHIGLKVRALARSKTMLSDVNGINLENCHSELANRGKAYTFEDIVALRDEYGLLNPVLVDCTTDENLARQYVDYINAGFHVVTANKKANTLDQAYYEKLRHVAQRNFRKFLYETNVGAGLPVLDTLQSLLRSGDELHSFQGILSGSLSLIMGLLQDGMKFSEAVLKAKDMGFTEPDPRDDLSGMDVGRKLLIMAREVGIELELDDVEIEALTPDWFNQLDLSEALQRLPELDADMNAKVEAAKATGKVLRYVGSIDEGVCKVGFVEAAADNAMAGVRDGENVIAMNTHYYNPKPLVLRGYGAGAAVTAAGLFGDILRTLRSPSDL